MYKALFLLTLLASCDPPDDKDKPIAPRDDTGERDLDGDGFSHGLDCDEDDPLIHPGADELCDGVDNDCDGVVDPPSSLDASTWYRDGDNDGYGDRGVSTISCYPGSDQVADASDCDDADASVHPGATELCNGVDDDCDDDIDPDSSADAPTWYTDADADGYGDPDTAARSCAAAGDQVDDDSDCDDADASVHPGATELCNGVDDDCDGDTDPATSADASTWYSDADADGYGDPDTAALSCAAASDQVADASDCDDADADVHPGATELCNGIDDDCDGDTDPPTSADASTWYSDADADGYGDPDTAALSCAAASDQVADASDCDDGDAAVHPGAAELCNGVDDDCDGAVDPDSSVDAPTWYADADADGYGDSSTAVVGCSATSGAVADASDCDDGDAAVHPGAVEWCGDSIDADCDGLDVGDEDCAPTGTSDDPDAWITTTSGVAFGSAVTVLGDCTGDAHAELVMGSPTSGSAAEGKAWLFTAFPTDDHSRGTWEADHVFYGDSTDDLFASALAGMPDLDGDGVVDLAVGAPGHDGGGTEAGAVWLFPGPDASDTHSYTSDASVVLYGEHEDDQAGSMLADGGDLDGDGLHDLLIAAPGLDTLQAEVGAIYVAFGGGLSSGTLEAGEQGRFDGERAGDALSVAAGLGDVDGDGYEDLAIGSPLADENGSAAGTVWVWFGPIAAERHEVAAAPLRIDGAGSGDGAGAAIVGRADVDADGFGDLWIGATGTDSPDSSAGSAVLFRGPLPSGAFELDDAYATITGSDRSDGAGGWLAAADFDADGWSDLAMAVPGAELLGAGQGGVFLFYGPLTDTSLSLDDADASLHGGSGTVAGQGLATFDVDEDSYDDLAFHVWASYSDRIELQMGAPRLPDTAPAPDLTSDDDGDGYSEAAGDCDDGDAARAPDHAEVCGDNVDEDCDGYADRCAPSASLLEGDLDSLVTNDHSTGSDFGVIVRAVGDLNGDGNEDLAVVGPDNSSSRDRVLIFFGPVPAGSDTGALADAVITSGGSYDGLGEALGSAGDLDGDGYDDLFVGAPQGDLSETDEGWVAVFRGGPGLLGELGVADADWIIQGGQADREAGWGGGGHDLNADGYDDLIIGASGEDTSLYSDAGMLAVVYGPLATGSHLLDDVAGLVILGTTNDERLGEGTSSVGDLNGDGDDDLLVWSPGWEHADAYTGPTENLGRFLLFEGPLPSTGTLDEHAANAVLGVPGYGFELAWTTCDLTGDGLHELVLGLDEYEWAIVELAGSRGAVELEENLIGSLYDPSGRIDERYVTLACGDADRDGVDDLALGFATGSGGDGELRVFYGPVSGDLSAAWPDLLLEGGSGHRLGTALELVDLDRDGFDDFVVGIPNHHDTANRGAFGVLRGGWTSRTTSPSVPRSSADDLDGDGYSIDDGDCHDGDADTHPGATEICGDARDQDCDGAAPDCAPLGSRTEHLPALQIDGYYGSIQGVLHNLGDINGDGLPDLAVDDYYEEATVMLSPLPVCGVAVPADYSTGELISTSGGYGSSGAMRSMPDLDGDGINELIINDGTGIFRVLDSGGGFASRRLDSALWGYELVFSGSTFRGNADGGLPFFPGDDAGLAVSSFLYNYYWYASEGAVYLYGVNADDPGVYTTSDAQVSILGEVVDDLLGEEVCAMGDLDGDGYGELAISAYQDTPTGDDVSYLWTSDMGPGSISAADLPVRLADEGNYTWMKPRAPGDLDGDGLDDMALCFPYYNDGFVPDGGRLYLWSGAPPDGDWRPPPADLTIQGATAHGNFGHDLADQVDFDGDGHLDLVVSAPAVSSFSPQGRILVWYGPMTLSGSTTSTGADGVIDNGVGWTELGYGLVPAGDVDADGTDDIWAGTTELPVLIHGGMR